ncbi:unnamed protein product [Adineta steineri]|uniref:Uncharacterized protein n=1 Tax=Adineta steineri TaxID=433720 RepID=A0A815NQG9_9BILA|nr:unnamed protein product [Adineta steineri]CAF3906801.1 unnamed protein product [Adineta steineri]CAF3937190.1 unnamed protein product [Adineta steineri]
MSSEATNQSRQLNILSLQAKPRLSIDVNDCRNVLASNEKYLLCYAQDRFLLIDEQGNEELSVQSDLTFYDMCWSSYLNQFIILSRSGELYALDTNEKQLKQIKIFDQIMSICTCYEKTFICSNGIKIEKYNLSNWQLEQTFEENIPYTGISQIRFNSDGTRLGFIIDIEGRIFRDQWFSLRNPSDMSKLQNMTKVGYGSFSWLLALPRNEQYEYMATICSQNNIYLLKYDRELNNEIIFGYPENITSTSIINDKCLVIHTNNPDKLHFYDI